MINKELGKKDNVPNSKKSTYKKLLKASIGFKKKTMKIK